MSERDVALQTAFEEGRAARIVDTRGGHRRSGTKLASDCYPHDDGLFEAYMQGWDAAEGLTDLPDSAANSSPSVAGAQ